MIESEVVQYIIINVGLKMGKGKMCAQAAHASITAFHKAGELTYDHYAWKFYWYMHGQAKIVLRSNEKTMKALHEKYPKISFPIYDQGRTQIPEGSFTALGFIPMPRNKIPHELYEQLQSMKLL